MLAPIFFTGSRRKDSTLIAAARRAGLVSPVNSASDDPGYELVTVKSGARTLRSLACGETFHPVVGPMLEAVALHVQGQRLVERARASGGPLVIWDVGLGAAANAIAAIEALDGVETPMEMHSFDRTLAPLAFAHDHAEALGYVAPWRHSIAALLSAGEWRDARRPLTWRVHRGDFRKRMADAPAPHAIFYDPYSAATNPELWTLEHFTALRARLADDAGCMLTNYTRSTAVRVTLLLAGFCVGRGGATGEKDQTTVATNRAELLLHPLDVDWLTRVGRSTRGAPLRAEKVDGRAIAAGDWAALNAHPQFAGS